jgi:hypothetical protein
VAGDPRIPLDSPPVGGDPWTGGSGYLGREELEQALSEATVAVFPYRARLDQSGALLQALGAGVPAKSSDVGTPAEIVGRFGAQAGLSPPATSEGLAAASAKSSTTRRRSAPRGRRRKRARALTWDAAAGRISLRGARVRLRRGPLDRSSSASSRFAEDDRRLLHGPTGGMRWNGPRHRGGIRRLPARRRRDRRPPARDPRAYAATLDG